MDTRPGYLVKPVPPGAAADDPEQVAVAVQTLLNLLHDDYGYCFCMAFTVRGQSFLLFQRTPPRNPADVRAESLMDSQAELTELAKENLLRQRVREEAHLAACPVCQQHGAGEQGQ